MESTLDCHAQLHVIVCGPVVPVLMLYSESNPTPSRNRKEIVYGYGLLHSPGGIICTLVSRKYPDGSVGELGTLIVSASGKAWTNPPAITVIL